MNSMKPAIVLTGATGAIGSEIAVELARREEAVVLACRNTARAEQLAERLMKENPAASVSTLSLDLESEDSVRTAVAALSGRPLKALVNNAGTMRRRYATDSGGRELTMVVNYFNTRLLTELLLPAIVEGGTVVFTTSVTRFIPQPKDLWVGSDDFQQLMTYARSKRALTAYAALLASHRPDLHINCADPGVVDSNMITMHRWYDPLADIFFRPFIRKPAQGAEPALRALYSARTARILTRRKERKLKKIDMPV